MTLRDRRGMTLVEAILGVAVVGALSASMALLFRTTLVASRRTGIQTELLANVRRCLHGDGAVRGALFDGLSAAAPAAASPASLSVLDAGGRATTYSLTSQGELVVSGPSGPSVRARGLGGLSFAYYGVDAAGLVFESTSPAEIRLVTISLAVRHPERTATFFSGGGLRNFE